MSTQRIDVASTVHAAENGCPFAYIALTTLAQTKPAKKTRRPRRASKP